MSDAIERAKDFFAQHPEIDVLEAFIVDVNGQLRGKWVPVDSAMKVMKNQLRFPSASYSADFWGDEVPASGVGGATGAREQPGRERAVGLALELQRRGTRLSSGEQVPLGAVLWREGVQALGPGR